MSERSDSFRLPRATRALVARFQRQRPMRAGSLLATLFGDAIAPRGGVVTLGSLIRLAEPFGIPDRLVRTSVGRLAQVGWLEFRRAGRQSEYFLTEHGESRFAEATQRIYGEAPHSWDSDWTLILLPSGTSAERERAREELRWLGFGQVASGVLAHPSRTVLGARRQLEELGIDTGVVVMRAASEGAAADRTLLEAGWDLAELARSYKKFIASFEPIRSEVVAAAPFGASGDRAPRSQKEAAPALTPEVAFIIRTLLIHEYRKIHLRDPLLPSALLPADWIGTQAYELCRDLYRRVFAAADAHITTIAETLKGRLSEASPDTYRRFGGLDGASPPGR